MFTQRLKPFFLLILFAIAIGGGYLLTKTADLNTAPAEQVKADNFNTSQESITPLPKPKPFHRPTSPTQQTPTNAEFPKDAIPNERLVRFNNDADYQAFLNSLKARGLTLLNSSDLLRAARIRTNNDSNLNGLENAEIDYNFLVSPPIPPDASAQEGAAGFGNSTLSWLGITGDNSSWGEGITVAVIDSGVNNHVTLNGGNGTLSFLNLTELSNGIEQLGHGTAVASIISGDLPLTPGVSPAANILGIRVTDGSGLSDSFTLAQGILQATISGVDIINISMGSASYSQVLADAVNYAQEQGVVIVASSGNEAASQLAYPARNDGVISVGAVEAKSQHLDFSNSGDDLNISAPGFQVNAAWGEDLGIAFSGTSASAPYVSGAIAATMSEFPDLSATEAANIVLSYTNDAGLPGDDNNYGAGILALDRIMERNTAGIYDAAIAGQVITEQGSNASTLITIQNQGTEPLINSSVVINTPNGIQNNNITSLLPGEIHTFTLPIQPPSDSSPVTITSSVNISETDKDRSNNNRISEFTTE